MKAPFYFFFLLIMISCKSETDSKVCDLHEHLKGNWIDTKTTFQYYDDSDNMISEYTDTNVDYYKTEYDGNGLSISTDHNHNLSKTPYQIIVREEGNFILYTDGENSAEYQIVSLTDKKMVLQKASVGGTYRKALEDIPAAKTFFIVESEKQ